MRAFPHAAHAVVIIGSAEAPVVPPRRVRATPRGLFWRMAGAESAAAAPRPLHPALEGHSDEGEPSTDRPQAAASFGAAGPRPQTGGSPCRPSAERDEPAPPASPSSGSQGHLEAGLDSASVPQQPMQDGGSGGGAGGSGPAARQCAGGGGGPPALVAAAAAAAPDAPACAAPALGPTAAPPAAAAAAAQAHSPEWLASLPVLPLALRPGVRHPKRDLPMTCQVVACGLDLEGQAGY